MSVIASKSDPVYLFFTGDFQDFLDINFALTRSNIRKTTGAQLVKSTVHERCSL